MPHRRLQLVDGQVLVILFLRSEDCFYIEIDSPQPGAIKPSIKMTRDVALMVARRIRRGSPDATVAVDDYQSVCISHNLVAKTVILKVHSHRGSFEIVMDDGASKLFASFLAREEDGEVTENEDDQDIEID